MGGQQKADISPTDRAYAEFYKSTLSPKISGLFDQPIAATGPKQILGESPQETMMREMGISHLNSAIPGAGSFTPNEQGASNFLGQTINGNFLDPTHSPVFQQIAESIRRQALNASGAAGDQLNANFAGAGHLGGSGPLMQARNDLAFRTGQGVTDSLSSFLMPLYQQQLGYQQNALPLSMQFGDMSRNLPLNQLNLTNQAYNLAGVPRTFQQQQIDEQQAYQDRVRASRLEPFQLALGLQGTQPQQNTTITPNAFTQQGLPIILGLLNAFANYRGGQTNANNNRNNSSSGGGNTTNFGVNF